MCGENGIFRKGFVVVATSFSTELVCSLIFFYSVAETDTNKYNMKWPNIMYVPVV